MDRCNIMMTSSSGYSDDTSYNMDEDVLNYLSTLTPNQQLMLEDFVSFNDHSSSLSNLNINHQQQQQQLSPPPAVIKFAYGNSVGANNNFGRPVSMYEPFVPQFDQEFSSLPPDLVSSNEPNSRFDEMDHTLLQKFSYEAEDAEYIETLNEMRDNFEYQNVEDHNYVHNNININKLTFVADVHCGNVNDVEYATVQKPKKHQSQMIISSESTSTAPPRQKFPKIMTQSCYGQLNNFIDTNVSNNNNNNMLWNSYEQDLMDDTANIGEDANQQNISSLTTATDSSIIDGISSINSSIYEQIPSMTSSLSIETATTARQRKSVKWFDDLHEEEQHTEESLQNLHETAEEGECQVALIY